MHLLFLELLQFSLGTRDGLSRVPTAVEWEALLDEADRQAIGGLLLCGLESLPSEQLPPLEVKLQWIGIAQITEATNRDHAERAKIVTSRFRSVGYKTCILKGLSSASRYPTPERRQCGDIDLWVDGRRKDVMKWLRSLYKIDRVLWHHAEPTIFDDVEVEVHFHPTWLNNPIHNYRLQRWFDKARPHVMNRQEFAGGYVTTTAEFDAVYQLAHTFHHLLDNGVGLRHIVDYFFVLKELNEEGRKEAIKTIRKVGMEKFAAAMMYVLQKACGLSKEKLLCEPGEKEGKYLLREIMVAGNFGKERIGEALRKNSLKRYIVTMQHYPSEVLWMVPWKVWHRGWRTLQNI